MLRVCVGKRRGKITIEKTRSKKKNLGGTKKKDGRKA